MMGVRGLQTFIEQHCQEAFELVEIDKIANQYRERTGIEPVVVVDVASCMRHLYGKLNWILGGQYKEFAGVVEKFLEKCKNIGIKLVLFFDGMPAARKHDIWVQRRLNSERDVYKIFGYLKERDVAKASDDNLFQLPGTAWSVIKTVFISSGFECYTTIREADEEIAEYAKAHDCFAILGQDTDYVILEGPHYYLSIQHFNLEQMRTRNYNREKLTQQLNIHISHLPLFATLSGNDIVPADALREFHFKLTGRRKNPYQILFPSVARYIKNKPGGKLKLEEFDKISIEVFGHPGMASKIRTSLQSYWLNDVDSQSPSTTGNAHWDEILSAARNRHVKCIAPAQIYVVMVNDPYYSTLVLEDYRDNKIPHSALALHLLRRRMYGLLLKERPGTERKVVTEWLMYGGTSLRKPHLATAILPEFHPGLLRLWDQNDETDDTTQSRWRVFCEAVSSKLDPAKLRTVPRTLVTVVASLFYLCHEIILPFLHEFEVEALLAQAVRVNRLSKEEIASHVYDHSICDPRAVHLSTVFQRTFYHVEILAAACGHPVTDLEASVVNFFDGKIFHSVFNETKQGTAGSELCGHEVMQIENYNTMRSIIFPIPEVLPDAITPRSEKNLPNYRFREFNQQHLGMSAALHHSSGRGPHNSPHYQHGFCEPYGRGGPPQPFPTPQRPYFNPRRLQHDGHPSSDQDFSSPQQSHHQRQGHTGNERVSHTSSKRYGEPSGEQWDNKHRDRQRSRRN